MVTPARYGKTRSGRVVHLVRPEGDESFCGHAISGEAEPDPDADDMPSCTRCAAVYDHEERAAQNLAWAALSEGQRLSFSDDPLEQKFGGVLRIVEQASKTEETLRDALDSNEFESAVRYLALMCVGHHQADYQWQQPAGQVRTMGFFGDPVMRYANRILRKKNSDPLQSAFFDEVRRKFVDPIFAHRCRSSLQWKPTDKELDNATAILASRILWDRSRGDTSLARHLTTIGSLAP